MKTLFLVVGVILVLIAALLPIGIAIFAPNEWIPRMQSAAVAYAAAFSCVGSILFIAVVALLALIAFQLKNNVVPLLEKATETLQTVKGTTTFVSESVVQPIIKTAGAVAGAKAMVQTLVRRNNGTGGSGK